MKILTVFFLLFATTASAATLTLTWTDNSNNEDGFNIERKLGQTGNFGQIGRVSTDVTTYIDVTVPDDQLYCYRVNAYDSGGVSPWSVEGCGRDTVSDILIMPGEVTVTQTTTTTTTTTTTVTPVLPTVP